MANEKVAKFIIDVSAESKRVFNSSVRFFSKDHRTAKFLIQAEKDKVAIPKSSISQVEILFESIDMLHSPNGKVIFNDNMTVESDGLFSYVLPDELLNYSGLMAFEVYIYYTNGDGADSSNRIIFEQRVSAIDRAAGAVELVYIKDMEQAKQAVADKADEVMADMSGYESSLADYEHQIKDGMDQLYDGVANASADEITKIREELPKVETAATEEITKIQAVLPDVQATAADETAKIKVQLPTVEAVAVAETEKIQAELPKVQSVTAEETTKIQSELPKVKTVAAEEIGKIRDVLSTVENTAQEVSDHADQKIAEYDAKFVSTDQKMVDLEQSQSELDAELKATQQQIIDADVYTKAEADVNAEGILDKRNLSAAWSWSKDGTDRFTTVYPGENLVTMDSLGRHANASVSNVTFIGPGRVNVISDGRPYIGFCTAGRQYQLSTRYSMKFKMVVNSGSVISIGGHTTYIYSIQDASINGVSQSLNWANGIGYNFENNKEYTVSIVFTTRDTEAMYTDPSAGIFIQPNRMGYGTAFDVDISELKIEEYPATIYTPAPSDDPLNAYPKYKGLRLAPSDNPADYDWSYTDEYVDYLKSSSVSKTEFNDLAARLAALENQGGI